MSIIYMDDKEITLHKLPFNEGDEFVCNHCKKGDATIRKYVGSASQHDFVYYLGGPVKWGRTAEAEFKNGIFDLIVACTGCGQKMDKREFLLLPEDTFKWRQMCL